MRHPHWVYAASGPPAGAKRKIASVSSDISTKAAVAPIWMRPPTTPRRRFGLSSMASTFAPEYSPPRKTPSMKRSAMSATIDPNPHCS